MPSKKLIKVGAVQMECVTGNISANLKKAQNLLDKAVKNRVQLLLFPELFSTGYDLKSKFKSYAENTNGKTVKFLLDNSKKHGIYLCGSFIEKIGNKIRNTAVLTGPKGIIGKHSKINLWGEEQAYFEAGESIGTYKTDIGCIGMEICYDVDFPEVTRILAMQNAQIVLVPTAGSTNFDKLYGDLVRSRAFENGCFVIFANRCGQEGKIKFAGCSQIIDPKAEVLAMAGRGEKLIMAELDFSEMEKQRKKAPYLKEFKREIYKKYF